MFNMVVFGNIVMLIGIIALLNTFVFFPGTVVFQEKLLPVLERWYRNFLTFALKGSRPILFIVGTFVLLIGSIVLFALNQPKVEFFPSNQAKFANVFITHPRSEERRVGKECK